MDNDVFFSDEMISEEFQEVVSDSFNNCSTQKLWEHTVVDSSQNNKYISESEITTMNENVNLDNMDKSALSDTISLNSGDDSCSGSSLHQYDSQNELPNSSLNPTTDHSLSDLRAAIRVKWMDRSVCIQKSIQNHHQDIWGSYINKLNSKDPIISESNSFKVSYSENRKCFDKNLSETLDSASKSKHKISNEEVQYTIKSTQFLTLVPKCTEVHQEAGILFHKPQIMKSIPIRMRNIRYFSPSSGDNGVINITNKETDINSFSNNTELSNQIMSSLREENKSLALKLMTKEKEVESIIIKLNDYLVMNNQIKRNLQVSEDNQIVLEKEMFKYKSILNKLEDENVHLRTSVENLRMFKVNAENKIMAEEKTREILEQKLDSYKNQEYEYQWLCQAFNDYKALGLDYDRLQLRNVELETQLGESTRIMNELHNQVESLKEEINVHKKHIDEIQTNQNHYYENMCQCSNPYWDHSYPPYKAKSSHKKYKKDKSKHRERSLSLNQDYQKLLERENHRIPKESVINDRIENIPPDPKELETRYDMLQMKKRTLESELCHVPLVNTTNRKGTGNTIRGEKEKIEDELDRVDLELSSIRRQMKQQKSINEGNVF